MLKKLFASIAVLLAMAPAAASYADERAIPPERNMLIRLETPLSTRVNRTGDPFRARVVEPERYEGAIVRGHVRDIDRSGRISGRTEMALAFDSIELPGERVQPFRAQVDDIRESESVKIVDSEGRLISGNRTSQTLTRSTIGAAVGGVLGGVLGGGKGALLGVLLGGGAGAGTVYAQGAREIRLDRGTELDIETDTTSQPRALARSDYDQDDQNSYAARDFEHNREFIRDVQNALSNAGYDPGEYDGHLGWRTREALRNFQRDQGLPVTGTIDRATAERLGIRG